MWYRRYVISMFCTCGRREEVLYTHTGRYAAVVKVTAMRQEVAANKSATEGLDATIARIVRIIPAFLMHSNMK